MLSNIQEVRARGADVIAIATEGDTRDRRARRARPRGPRHARAAVAGRGDRAAAALRVPRGQAPRLRRRPAEEPGEERHRRVALRLPPARPHPGAGAALVPSWRACWSAPRATAAHACSCARRRPTRRACIAPTARSSGRSSVGPRWTTDLDLHVRVETPVKGTLGAEVDVRSAANGACLRPRGRVRPADRPPPGQRGRRGVDVEPVLPDRPRGAAARGGPAPRAGRRRSGPLRGRRQPGREPADRARPQGQDARVRRRATGYARDVDVCPGARGSSRPSRWRSPGTAGRAGAAVARRGPDDHARRDATSLAPAGGMPERARRPTARRRAPRGRVLAPSSDGHRRSPRVARARARRRASRKSTPTSSTAGSCSR